MSVSEIESTLANGSGSNSASEAANRPAVLELEQLRHRCLGNDQLVNQILGKIDRTLATELQRFRAALDQDDLDAAAALAHRLKGTAANIGAERFKLVAKNLEMWARQGEKTQLMKYFTELQQERDCLCAEINRAMAAGTLTASAKSSTEVPR